MSNPGFFSHGATIMKRSTTQEPTKRILSPEGHLISDRHRIMKGSRKISGLLLALLLLIPYFWIPFVQQLEPKALAGSQVNNNLSSDLEDAINGGGMVQVIIDTKPSGSSQAFSNLIDRISQLGGGVSRILNNNKQLAVNLPAAAVRVLASDNAVRYISLDRPTQVMGHLETTTGAAMARSYGTYSTGTIDGGGIGIAVLDSGIYAAHHSFGPGGTSRVVASIDFTGEGRTDDPYGHGTHVAGVAAGNNHVAQGAYTGIAPGANLINVRVLGSLGQGSTSNAIAGIDWCIANKILYNIRVLNLSLGATAVDSYVNDPLCQAVRRAFNAGLVVCVAAGNNGKDAAGHKVYGGIHSPGIEPSAITVGAANSFGTDSRADDSVTSFSSRGPTRGYVTDALGVKKYDNLIKPDLVAPGNKILEPEAPFNYLVQQTPSLDGNVSPSCFHEMMSMSGTSMATPAVAGAAALILQRNPGLTPNL